MKDILKKQIEFEEAIGVPIHTILEKERNQLSEVFIFKLIEEAIETRREFPSAMNEWSKSQTAADVTRVQEELSDVFIFFLNVLLTWRIDWSDFLQQVRDTQYKNFTKIKERKMKMFNEEIMGIPGYTVGIGSGSINPKYIFIGQNPGKNITHGYRVWSDPESGSSKILLPLLDEQQVRDQCYFTNLVKCTTLDNAEPTEEQSQFWRPRLIEEVAILTINNPGVTIISMGKWVKDQLGADSHVSIPHPSWVLRNISNLDAFTFELLNAMKLQPILNI